MAMQQKKKEKILAQRWYNIVLPHFAYPALAD